jgi:D-beta-D-heptose 7-phosphate kinase / D-beta-D-heptose 1-phosphate adenosyltransferase
MVERMDNLKTEFSGAHVLVIGDVMLDEYVIGAVSRISPEAPVPVLDVRSRYHSPGGAANVAMNIASLGATAYLAGVVGNDAAGHSLRRLLQANSISTSYLVEDIDRGTISKTRIIAGQQQICRIDHEERTPMSSAKLLASVDSALGRSSVVVLSDYAKGTLTDECCGAIISRARGKQIIVDPKSKDFHKYSGCTLITPNLSEASAASGVSIDSEESLHRAGAQLLAQLPGTSVLITRGPDGMTLFQPAGAAPLAIPTQARKVFDVVGAGDTVVATVAVALAACVPLSEAVQLANIAAGLVVEKPGTATVTFEELALRRVSKA